MATKNKGMNDLVRTIVPESERPPKSRDIKHVEYGSDIKKVIDDLESLLDSVVTDPYPRHWAAMKLLEGDNQISKLIEERVPAADWKQFESFLRENENAAVAIATLRFKWVDKIVDASQEKPPIGQVSLTEKIDRIATHPVLGLLLMIAIMSLIFWLVYALGVPIQNFLEVNLIQKGQELLYQHFAFLPACLLSFLGNGILSGMGTVLTFIPILFFFFIAWAFLEDVGYTSRAAFVTDGFMHHLGLHGKSCLPMILGFGCNVPAVLGTRIIDSKRARLLTIILTPLVPCTGRMAVISIIAAAFFGGQAVFVSIGMVILSLLILVLTGLILNRFVLKGESGALIMELPLYHMPNPRLIGLVTCQSIKAFVKRAGTVILAVSLIVWLLSIIPGGSIDNSVLAQIGKWLEPLGRLMGLNWQMMVALISSFVAKENTIATLGVLLGGQGAGLEQQLHTILAPAAALAFLVIQVLFIPCVATISVIRQETGGWKWPVFTVVYQLVLSLVMAILVFQIANLIISAIK